MSITETQGILQACYDSTTKALRVTSAGDAVLVGPGDFILGTGPAVVTTNGIARVALDGAATESVFFNFVVPTAWTAFVMDLFWSNETAGAGNVRWSIATKVLINTDLLTEAATTTASTIAAPAQNVIKRSDAAQTITAVTDAAYATQLSRLGGDALDTLSADIGLLGVRIRQGGS